MQVINEIFPTDPEQQKQMMQPGPEGPIYMVNLLKFRARAEYEDGRETELSGREAYNLYAKEVAKLITQFGGKLSFLGDVTFLAIGQVEDLWDEIAIAEYSDRGALLKMSMSPKWREISVHRSAGLEGQLNIETVSPFKSKV